MAEKIFMKGCEAVAETAVRAGCRFFAGYPITPQNDVPEYFARRMPQVGGVFIQGESEVASANMAFGAAAAGVRSMTSSSSCGISLKSEAISWMAGARLPVVVANFQRGGPGIGTIQPAQQDYTQATKASGNGRGHDLGSLRSRGQVLQPRAAAHGRLHRHHDGARGTARGQDA